MAKRQYVTYEEVRAGLHRPWDQAWWNAEPYVYLRRLREDFGLSWAKLAHDLSVDSGCRVSGSNAKRWAEG